MPQFWKYIEFLYSQKKASRGYHIALRDFLCFLNVILLTDEAEQAIKSVDIFQAQEYMQWQKTQTGMKGYRSNTTQKTYYDILRHTYQFLLDQGLVTSNPFSGLKAPDPKNNRVRPSTSITAEKVRLIMQLPKDSEKKFRDVVLVVIMLATGMRRSEICKLQIQDFSFNKDKFPRLRVIAPKVGGDRFCYIPRWAFDVFFKWYNQRLYKGAESASFIFCSLYGANKYVKHMSDQSVNDVFKAICKKVGIDYRVSAHSARHTFATQCFEEEIRTEKIKQALGHNFVGSTIEYMRNLNEGANSAGNELKYLDQPDSKKKLSG